MDPLFFLLIVAIVWFILIIISMQSWFTIKNPEIGLGFIMYRTQRFSGFIERIAKHGHVIWNILLDSGIVIAIGILIATVGMLGINLAKYLYLAAIKLGLIADPYAGNASQAIATVDIVPAIPGLSISLEVLPYFMIAILIGAAFHEAFHGVATCSAGLKLKSTGVFVFFLFLGAFVEPDEEEVKKASPRTKMRIFAAGALANVILTGFFFLLLLPALFFPVVGFGYETTPSGALIAIISPDSPAEKSGLLPNWVITEINSTAIQSSADFHSYASYLLPNQSITISFHDQASITLTTAKHPQNQSRGFIGLSSYDFYSPKYTFLPYNLPYLYYYLLYYTLSINFMLAIMNLLPIPLLDGDRLFAAFIESRLGNSKTLHNSVRWAVGLIFLGNIVLTLLIKGWTVI